MSKKTQGTQYNKELVRQNRQVVSPELMIFEELGNIIMFGKTWLNEIDRKKRQLDLDICN